MKKLTALFTFAIIISGLFGCSEKKDDSPLVQTKASVHGAGFIDPASSNFHAKFVKEKKYDLTVCQSCHGTDYAGGTTGQSCNSCHNKPNGPENCTTCHGSNVNAAPPKDLLGNIASNFRGVGAHQKHLLGGSFAAPVACNECHTIPKKLTDVGHIDATTYAEVRFDTTTIFYNASATYNAGNVSCSNTYCHGNRDGGNNVTVTWNDTSSSVAACGTCHGDVNGTTLKEKAFPKTSHTYATVTANCETCHGAVVDANLTIIDPSRHVNGKLN